MAYAVRSVVHTALNNAVENGYDMASLTPEQIIIDLQTYDADLEDKTTAEILPHVEEWLIVRAK